MIGWRFCPESSARGSDSGARPVSPWLVRAGGQCAQPDGRVPTPKGLPCPRQR